MSREKGFVLPLTVMCTFLCLTMFIHFIELYMTEVKFAKEEEQWYEGDILMNNVVERIKEKLVNVEEEVLSLNETLIESNGQASYAAVRIDEKTWRVTVSCLTVQDFKYEAEFLFSLIEGEIIEWKERY
jgi:competence protein ComGG